MDPGDSRIVMGWGLALSNLKRYEEAIEKYRKATEIDPKNADAFFFWGLTLYSLKRFEDTLDKFQKVTEIDPKYAGAFFNWGLALDNLRRYDEAVEMYEKAGQIDPDDPYSFHSIAALLFKFGRYKEGWKAWEKAVKVYRRAREKKTELSSTADFWGNYGDVLFSVFGQLDEAERTYKEGLSIDPHHTGALASLCELYLERAADDSEQKECSLSASDGVTPKSGGSAH